MAAKRLIREHELPMKVVGVDHVDAGADGDQRTRSTSPPRTGSTSAPWSATSAPPCAAGSSCASSPRDAARVQGGIGSCGRDLCCATFLTDFEPVTIRMAKDQDLPLNPLRISGACGRLMCCLKYEHPLYQEFARVGTGGRQQGHHPAGRGHRDRPPGADRCRRRPGPRGGGSRPVRNGCLPIPSGVRRPFCGVVLTA